MSSRWISPGAWRRAPLTGKPARLSGRWQAGGRVDRRRVRLPREAARSDHPPALPEPAPLGVIIQPKGEFAASKSKEIQANLLGFTLNSFGRIGTFQWVTFEKIKKFLSFLLTSEVVARNRVADMPFPSRSPILVGREFDLTEISIHRHSEFVNKLATNLSSGRRPYPATAWRRMRLTESGSSNRNVTGRATTARAWRGLSRTRSFSVVARSAFRVPASSISASTSRGV